MTFVVLINTLPCKNPLLLIIADIGFSARFSFSFLSSLLFSFFSFLSFLSEYQKFITEREFSEYCPYF